MHELRRQNAWINDNSLRSVDARIINVRAIEQEAQMDMSYAARPTMPGQLLMRRIRRSKKIQVQFAIRELYDLAARTDILDAVNAWARDGMLEISTRPDQMAQVIVTKYANAADVREYTDNYMIEFEACGVPYWQDKAPTPLIMMGTNLTGTLVIGGNAETVLDAAFTATGGTLDSLSITATSADGSSTSFSFSGLGIAAGGALIINHDERGILRIKNASGVGLMGKRTAASDDELWIKPGTVSVAFTANTAVAAAFQARGWYR